MKTDDVQSLIRAHYESEEDFHSVVERIIKAEEKAGKDISASRIRATLNQYGGKKRDGYTVRALHDLSALNRNNIDMVEVRRSDIMLQDVITSQDTMETLQNTVNEFKHRERLTQHGLDVSNKLLLDGPPGVGKTWTALAVAGELGLDLIFVRWDSVVSSYMGSTGANIRKVFETASAEPVVLLLDEFDAVGKERGGSQEVGEMSRVVITVLQNIDMFPEHSFLVVATNHGQLLDTAVWRRFTVAPMGLPSPACRAGLINRYSKGLPIRIELEKWVADTEGLSGAEIKARIQREAKHAIMRDFTLSAQPERFSALCGK